MKIQRLLYPSALLALIAVVTKANEVRLLTSVPANLQASPTVQTSTLGDTSLTDCIPGLHPAPAKRKRNTQGGVAPSPGNGDIRSRGSLGGSQPNEDVFPTRYPAEIKHSIGTPAPVQNFQSPQGLHGRVMEEFYLIALRMVDWIIPVFLLSGTVLIVAFMYRYRYNNGLLFGAGTTGGIFALVQSDSNTPTPLLIVMLLAYLLFHITYCRTIILALRLGEGFAALASAIAMLLLAGLSQVPGLSAVWTESTGMAGVWSFLPVHLIAFFGSAVAVKMVQTYMKHEHDSTPLLPISTSDIDNVLSTSRLDGVPESRRRVMADSNAAI